MSARTAGLWKAKGADGRYDNRKNSWTVEDEESACSTCIPITTADGDIIGFAVASSDDYFSDDSEIEANAEVMAAAPQMINLLQRSAAIVEADPSLHKEVQALLKRLGEWRVAQ